MGLHIPVSTLKMKRKKLLIIILCFVGSSLFQHMASFIFEVFSRHMWHRETIMATAEECFYWNNTIHPLFSLLLCFCMLGDFSCLTGPTFLLSVLIKHNTI